MRKIVLLMLAGLFAVACGEDEIKLAYDEAEAQLTAAEQMIKGLGESSTPEEIADACTSVGSLSFEYNPIGLDSSTVAYCAELKARIVDFKDRAEGKFSEMAGKVRVNVVCDDDLLLEKKTYYAARMNKGDVFHYALKSKSPLSFRILNADSHSVERTVAGRTSIEGEYNVEHSAVYYFEVTPGASKYVDINLGYNVSGIESITGLKKVALEEKECRKGDFLASGVEGIKTIPVFAEAQKFTLRSQLKSIFSGSDQTVIPVIVPSGTREIIFSLRISTSEGNKDSDGKFDANVNYSYHKVRFLGMPVWNSSRGSSLIDKLLDDNRPLCEEDAYCSMYVFRNQNAAKKFQDGVCSITDSKYDLDYSRVGTQSCNGRVPMNGQSKVYLAFQNERMRYTCYIWVEVSAVVPLTEYFNYSYTLLDYCE